MRYVIVVPPCRLSPQSGPDSRAGAGTKVPYGHAGRPGRRGAAAPTVTGGRCPMFRSRVARHAGIRDALGLGVFTEPAGPLPSDTSEVRRLLSSDGFAAQASALARDLGRNPREVRAEVAGYLREMGATHTRRAVADWGRMSRWLTRAHDLVLDPEQLRRLRRLDETQSLLFPFSHRSY